MRLVLICLITMSFVSHAQNSVPLSYYKGHLCLETTASNNRQIRVIIDTGSRLSLVFSDILIERTRNPRTLVGVSSSLIRSEYDGLLVTRDFCVRAAYVAQRKKYDAVLGLDWMVQHRARIDVEQMRLIFYDTH